MNITNEQFIYDPEAKVSRITLESELSLKLTDRDFLNTVIVNGLPKVALINSDLITPKDIDYLVDLILENFDIKLKEN